MASVAIGANIAEGSLRFSSKEQAHFYSISYGSLMELMSHSFTALDLNYLNDEVFEKTKSIVQPLSLKINNLRNAAFAKAEKQQLLQITNTIKKEINLKGLLNRQTIFNDIQHF